MIWFYKINSNRQLLCLFILVAFFSYFKTSAYTIDELQQKIEATNQTKAQLEKEIAAYETQLKAVGEEKDTLQNAIKTLELSGKKIATDIKLNQNKISTTNLQIEELTNNIGQKKEKINSNLGTISFSLREMDREGSQTILESFLADKRISDTWNKIEVINRFQDSLKKQTAEVKETKAVLEGNKTEAEKKKKELITLKNQLLDRQKILESNKKAQSTLLALTKNQESNYRKLLDDRLAKKDAFEKELFGYENALKIAIDPKSIPAAGKGVLSWPVNNVRITQLFGKTAYSARLYTSGSHNGVDFGVPVGSIVKAARGGVIVGTGDTDTVCPGASYGKWVLIKHDNGLTTVYGHLSLIKVFAGQTVNTGDIIAYSGNTGYSIGPHLHLSVYASQGVKVSQLKSAVCKGTYTMPIADVKAYLDPMIYL
ncbi:MAG: peptidoglycan DD-metalloendopeptidase family protein [bacterium]